MAFGNERNFVSALVTLDPDAIAPTDLAGVLADVDVEAGEDDAATTAAAPVGKPQDADAALVEKVVRQILLELHK